MLENKIDQIIYKKFKNDNYQNQNKKTNNLNKIKPMATKPGKIKPKIDKKLPIQKSRGKNKIINSNNSNKKFLNKQKKKNNHSKNFISKIPKNINSEAKIVFYRDKPDTDYELNWLNYKEALIYDKRETGEYYCSLIRSKQLFVFTFCSFNDYNSGVVKKFMFFLSFALHYPTNALFFDESNMHQIYEDEGYYNFRYQLPYILYSSIISTVTLRLMLHNLVLTDKDIIYVKHIFCI